MAVARIASPSGRVDSMVPDSGAQSPEPPPVLVRAFLDASRDALDFLAGQPDFHSAVTVERATDNGIVAVAPDAVGGVFWARRTFSTSRLTGVLTYGERELEINLVVGLLPTKRGLIAGLLPTTRGAGPYGLWEWEAALGTSQLPDGESNPSWCATSDRVRAAVIAMGRAFRDIAPRIAAAGADVVRRIETARTQRWAAEKVEHARWEHQNAAARAADAFRAGDYRRVVSLLAPLEASLTPAEQKKLALARKRL
jgi:hypothetical protein